MKLAKKEIKLEEAMIRKAVNGDRNAFSMLVEKHYSKIYGIAWKFSGKREDAEDIAQDAVIKLAKNLKMYRFEAAFTTWLYRLTVNTAKDYIRSKNRKTMREMPLKEEILATVETGQDKALELKEVLKEVDKLPPPQREVIILVCWEGLTHKEAADILECAETTVSWRLYEARKLLGKLSKGETS